MSARDTEGVCCIGEVMTLAMCAEAVALHKDWSSELPRTWPCALSGFKLVTQAYQIFFNFEVSLEEPLKTSGMLIAHRRASV